MGGRPARVPRMGRSREAGCGHNGAEKEVVFRRALSLSGALSLYLSLSLYSNPSRTSLDRSEPHVSAFRATLFFCFIFKTIQKKGSFLLPPSIPPSIPRSNPFPARNSVALRRARRSPSSRRGRARSHGLPVRHEIEFKGRRTGASACTGTHTRAHTFEGRHESVDGHPQKNNDDEAAPARLSLAFPSGIIHDVVRDISPGAERAPCCRPAGSSTSRFVTLKSLRMANARPANARPPSPHSRLPSYRPAVRLCRAPHFHSRHIIIEIIVLNLPMGTRENAHPAARRPRALRVFIRFLFVFRDSHYAPYSPPHHQNKKHYQQEQRKCPKQATNGRPRPARPSRR